MSRVGPTALFDKSFLQSLSVDESVWFDLYFIPVVTPLFFVETLADLEKERIRPGRTVEEEVRIIADKTPELSSVANIHHATLCESELRGKSVPMQSRPVISGGKYAIADGKKGVVLDIAPEADALNRWQRAQFFEVERRFAKDWRAGLAAPPSLPGEDYLRWHRDGLEAFKTLEQIRDHARNAVAAVKLSAHERIKFVFEMLAFRRDLGALAGRYFQQGAPSIAEYAPYAAHVLTVEVFFRFAVERGFISRDRASNRVDIAYLHYLPFSHIFVSGDRLHKMTAMLFLRPDQLFVWGPDLKADLKRIDEQNKALPPEVQERGVMNFASRPPTEGNILTTQIWDQIMTARWRNPEKPAFDGEAHKEFVDRIKRLDAAVHAGGATNLDFTSDEADALVVKRRQHKRKGHWYQLPKDFPET